MDHPHPTKQNINVNAWATPTMVFTKNEPIRARAPSCCENLGIPRHKQNIPEKKVPKWTKKTNTFCLYEDQIVQWDVKIVYETNKCILKTFTYRNLVLDNCISYRTMPNRQAIREWPLSWLMNGPQVIHRVSAGYLPVAALVQCFVFCCSYWCDDFQPSLSFCSKVVFRTG